MKANLIPSKCRTYARLLPLCAALLLLFLPGVLRAQDTGYITGTVVDNSGAAVNGAKVVIATVTGNLTRETVTNSDGVYNVPGLPGATYTITVTAPGFQKFLADRVVLDVAQKARVDVQLTVGAITEEVIVSGENVAQVDTQSAELGTTITGKQVDRLELNGRNFTQLVTLVPGVVNQTGADEGEVGIIGNVQYSINGGRTEYNNWEIDGGDNMDNGSNTSLNVYPNLEAIAEFKVLTSNYGAQYGRNASGTVEVELKSGTKDFHGSAFEYLRNDFFNANSWSDNGEGIARPEYKKHDFGGTIGGPLYIPHVYNNEKKKTFFFFSEEARREIVPSANGPINQPVPSAQERMGNFNDVCPVFNAGATFSQAAFPECPYQALNTKGFATPFPNNTVSIASTAQALLPLIPQANNLTGINGNYFAGQAAGQPIPSVVDNAAYPTYWREELLRIDHNITDNERLAIHYIHDSWNTVNQGPLWGVVGSSFDNTNTAFVGPTTSFVARLTSNFTPTLLNEFVASYTADHINLTELGNVGIPSSGIDLVPLFANGLEGKLPALSIGNSLQNEYGNGFLQDTGYFPWKNANPTYTYRDNMTKILGTHTLIFGAYFAAAQKNQQSTANLQGVLSFSVSNPNTTGNPFADFLTGQISSYSQTSAQPLFYDRYKILEPYFQDDWRVTKKFTVNLGLRWSIFGRYQEKFNQEFGFSTNAFVKADEPAFNLPSVNAQTLVPGTGNVFNGFIQCGAKGVVTGCEKNKYVNPGPRLGFAWDPRGDGKWALRGGYGIFFEHANGNEANAESLQEGPSPNVLNGTVNNVPGYANVGAAAAAGTALSPLNPVSIPDRVQWPYVQQWNLDVEHELPGHILMQVSYVGSKGTHLVQTEDINQLQPVSAANNPYPKGVPITMGDCSSINFDPVTGFPTSATISTGAAVTGPALTNLAVACGNSLADYSRPFLGFGSITRIENEANSNYNALQVEVNRTVGDLTFSASYTYSHSLDDSSDRFDPGFPNSFTPAAGYASSAFDQRHSLELSYVYAFPFFKRAGLAHTLLGGWQASGITTIQSGLPFYVTDGSGFAADNAGVANGVGGTAAYLTTVGNPYAVTQAEKDAVAAAGVFGVLKYNPAAFDLPTGLTFGDSGRNELRLPGRTNFDFGLFKRFAFKERYAFEFRWENFNVFNHTQLDVLDGNKNAGATGLPAADTCSALNAGDPTCAGQGFLVLNGAHLPRIMQFGLRFQF